MSNQPVSSQQNSNNDPGSQGWWGFSNPSSLQTAWNSKAPGIVAAMPSTWQSQLFPGLSMPEGVQPNQAWGSYFSHIGQVPNVAGPMAGKIPGSNTNPPPAYLENNPPPSGNNPPPSGNNPPPSSGSAGQHPTWTGGTPTWQELQQAIMGGYTNPAGIMSPSGLISTPTGQVDEGGFRQWSPGKRQELGFGEKLLGSGTNEGSFTRTGLGKPWSPNTAVQKVAPGATAQNLNPGVDMAQYWKNAGPGWS